MDSFGQEMPSLFHVKDQYFHSSFHFGYLVSYFQHASLVYRLVPRAQKFKCGWVVIISSSKRWYYGMIGAIDTTNHKIHARVRGFARSVRPHKTRILVWFIVPSSIRPTSTIFIVFHGSLFVRAVALFENNFDLKRRRRTAGANFRCILLLLRFIRAHLRSQRQLP
jgi:hypothetical protein